MERPLGALDPSHSLEAKISSASSAKSNAHPFSSFDDHRSAAPNPAALAPSTSLTTLSPTCATAPASSGDIPNRRNAASKMRPIRLIRQHLRGHHHRVQRALVEPAIPEQFRKPFVPVGHHGDANAPLAEARRAPPPRPERRATRPGFRNARRGRRAPVRASGRPSPNFPWPPRRAASRTIFRRRRIAPPADAPGAATRTPRESPASRSRGSPPVRTRRARADLVGCPRRTP